MMGSSCSASDGEFANSVFATGVNAQPKIR